MKERDGGGLRWDDVRVFLAIRRHGTMAGAARELGVDQTTIGRRLASLETSLGARLFDRTPDGLILTPAGESVVEAALQVEASVMALARRAGGEDRRAEGTVRIATSDAFAEHFLVPRLGLLRERHPGVVLEITTSQSFVALSRREADLAVRLRSKGAVAAQENVIQRKIAEIGWAVAGAPGYLDPRGRLADPDDLSGHEVIGFAEEAPGVPGKDWLASASARAGAYVRVTSIVTALAAAEAGLGLALLPCFMATSAGLERVGPIRAWAEAWLLVHPDLQHIPRVRGVMEAIAEIMERDAALLRGDS